jgi:hypothetical protein
LWCFLLVGYTLSYQYNGEKNNERYIYQSDGQYDAFDETFYVGGSSQLAGQVSLPTGMRL